MKRVECTERYPLQTRRFCCTPLLEELYNDDVVRLSPSPPIWICSVFLGMIDNMYRYYSPYSTSFSIVRHSVTALTMRIMYRERHVSSLGTALCEAPVDANWHPSRTRHSSWSRPHSFHPHEVQRECSTAAVVQHSMQNNCKYTTDILLLLNFENSVTAHMICAKCNLWGVNLQFVPHPKQQSAKILQSCNWWSRLHIYFILFCIIQSSRTCTLIPDRHQMECWALFTGHYVVDAD